MFLDTSRPVRVRIEAFAGLLLTALMMCLGLLPSLWSLVALLVAPAVPLFMVVLATPYPLRRFAWLRRYLIGAAVVSVICVLTEAVFLVVGGATFRWNPHF